MPFLLFPPYYPLYIHMRTVNISLILKKKEGKNMENILNKPTSTIYSWRRNGNLPEYIFLKIGGCIFVRKDKFEKFINGEIA